jgi:hypothetical protein
VSALLLALAVAAPVLLAEDSDHDHDNDRGRFVDPIVGSWIIHVTVDTTPTFPLTENRSHSELLRLRVKKGKNFGEFSYPSKPVLLGSRSLGTSPKSQMIRKKLFFDFTKSTKS